MKIELSPDCDDTTLVDMLSDFASRQYVVRLNGQDVQLEGTTDEGLTYRRWVETPGFEGPTGDVIEIPADEIEEVYVY